MRARRHLLWFALSAFLVVGAVVHADGDTPTRVLVVVDEWVEGEPGVENYAMYVVAQQLRGMGFEVVNGRASAWFEADTLDAAVDYVIQAESRIDYSHHVDVPYADDTAGVSFRRSGTVRLLNGSDTSEVLSEHSFENVGGMDRQGLSVGEMIVAARLESRKRCANFVFIELCRSEAFKPLIPEAQQARIAKLIKSYEDAWLSNE